MSDTIEKTRDNLGKINNIIAVASGKGGVGKSTTAVNLALGLALEGARVGILDADIYGPSLAIMLGITPGTRPEIKEEKYFVPLQVHGLQLMSMAFLVDESQPMVWRGPMATGALKQLLTQTLWGELDYLIVDMPPGTGDIHLTLTQSIPLAGAVIVTTPQDIALSDARKGIEMFRKVNVDILGIIENMSLHTCSQCGHTESIFGEGGGKWISSAYQADLLASLPLDVKIRQQTDAGQPIVLAEPDGEPASCYREAARKMMTNLSAKEGLGGDTNPSIEIVDD